METEKMTDHGNELCNVLLRGGGGLHGRGVLHHGRHMNAAGVRRGVVNDGDVVADRGVVDGGGVVDNRGVMDDRDVMDGGSVMDSVRTLKKLSLYKTLL